MLYRIYFRHDLTKEENVREIEAMGKIYRICDDHGRVVFGEPWLPKDYPTPDPLNTKEPPMFRDD